MAFKQQDRFWDSPSHYIQWNSHPCYQTILCTSHNYHSSKPGQSNSQFKVVTTEIKKQKTVEALPPYRMITANHDLSQHSGCHHFSRFDCDAKAYAADTDTENSDCLNEEEQTYYTVSNNNSFEEPESKKNNSAINFALSELSQHIYECQQYHEKYPIWNALFAHLQA